MDVSFFADFKGGPRVTSEPRKHTAVGDTAALLKYYNFDLGGYAAEQVVARWTSEYDVAWVRAAAIEALYQGRYKAVSIEQILKIWQRRGQPLYHFKHDFERLVSRNLPAHLYPPEYNSSPETNYSPEDSLPFPLARESRSPQLPEASRATNSRATHIELSPSDMQTENMEHADADEIESELPSEPFPETLSSEAFASKTVDRFVPFSDRSYFLERLKSVARSGLQEQEERNADTDRSGDREEF